jgi:hypothetical protein
MKTEQARILSERQTPRDTIFSYVWENRSFEQERTMTITLYIVGSLLVLFGAIWFLQGINVMPGSFMTGQIQWAVYGGIAVAVGISLLLVANRRRKSSR